MSKQLNVSNDEFKILMAYRHKNELASLEQQLVAACAKAANRQAYPNITPEMVAELRTLSSELDDLMMQCGFGADIEAGTDDELTGATVVHADEPI
jgi:hypothetical protein